MTTLRNEIIEVKELAKRFSSKEVYYIQLGKNSSSTIEKTLVKKLGYNTVTGLRIEDVKNERFDPKRVGTVNPLSGSVYNETEFRTISTWIFE